MNQASDKYNDTYVTFVGHVELYKYRYLYFTVMFIVYILILCSNSIVVYLVYINENLHEPMYIFIAALLLNCLLFSTNIYPKLLIDFLSDKQITSFLLCHFQAFLYYSLSGSELLLLAAMAYDRYVSICKPLQYSTIMRKTTVRNLLVLAWILPACQLVPSIFIMTTLNVCNLTLKAIFCNNAVSKLYCMSSNTLYVIYGVVIILSTILFPMLFILFTYLKILIISHRSSKIVRKKAAQTCTPHLLVLISFSCLWTYDIVIARLEIDLHKTARLILSLQVILYHPLFNPIIYGLKMQKISKHIKRLFCKLSVSLKTNV
ncbi:olfactory receptor 2T1-like [Leuresthes tenuis]|uniref:olfactory receptor 2T1-like n=1 Tax=Leuresthes tenuis TaxID=355514 RepID=UPI003B515028